MATRFRPVLAIGVIALFAAGSKLIDQLTTPWANPFSSTGTLTGEWASTAYTPTGRPLRLWLQITLRSCKLRTGSCPPYGEGLAVTCDERGTFRSYRMTVSVPKGDETRIRVELSGAPETANGVHNISSLTGSRSSDTLRLEGRLHAPGPVTTRLWTDENGVNRSSIRAGHPDAEANTAWTLYRSSTPLPATCPRT
ncbi:hypothetical protein [Belnapia sp. F-4-1]|uniref:hypothetical protein n=1 Tax=Belnapia sp. F-4-1 TaxID=1545443 RepID=UPI001184B79D|nr:hypothetical protein [Belnapia sp. F-4-1]